MARGDCNITNICIPTRRIIYSAGFTPPAPPPPPPECNFPEGSFAQGGQICNWGYRVRWDIDPSKVPSDQTNYLAYINLAELTTDLSPGNNALFWNDANRAEFRVTTSDGATEIPHYTSAISTVNETGYIWALVPSVSSSVTTSLFIYFANPAATEYAVGHALGRNATFTGAGFAAIWDFEQDPAGTAPQLTDLTGNGYNGTAVAISGSIARVAGKVGSAWRLVRANNQTVHFGDVLDIGANEPISVGAIALYTNSMPSGISDANRGRLVENRGTGSAAGWSFGFTKSVSTMYATLVGVEDNTPSLWRTYNTTAYPVGAVDTHLHLATTMKRTVTGELKIFAAGAQVGATITSAGPGLGDANNTRITMIGGGDNGSGTAAQTMDGDVSFAWVVLGVVAPDRITTEYNNQNAPGTFATFTNFQANT